MRTWRSCTRLTGTAWHPQAVGIDHAFASLKNVRLGAECTDFGSCLVKCHYAEPPSYCSTFFCEFSDELCPMLNTSICCFGSSTQDLFVIMQMISCFMQTLFEVMLSPAEILTQAKVR